jgi:hypothetical protein
MNIDRPQLWKSKPEYLIRLAKFLGIRAKDDDCICYKCMIQLINEISRRLHLIK